MCEQKGGKKGHGKAAKTEKAGALVLNEDLGGGVINDEQNMSEMNRQKGLTIMGESKKIPEWMKDGASQKDKDVLCEFVNLYTPDGKRELVRNARVQFVYGRRYGLIGPNGTGQSHSWNSATAGYAWTASQFCSVPSCSVILGKTTLIRHVSEYLLPDFPKHLRVVHVAQHADVASEGCVLEHVVHSDEEKAYLESEQDRLLAVLEGDEDGEIDETADVDAINSELERLAQRLEDIDARRAENRAAAILSGLGFTPLMQQSKISSLSGGWRQRVALACALFVAPDILLLGQSECTGSQPLGCWTRQRRASCAGCLWPRGCSTISSRRPPPSRRRSRSSDPCCLRLVCAVGRLLTPSSFFSFPLPLALGTVR